MTPSRDGARVADLVLERYRLGELPPGEVAALERRLEGDAELRDRLAALADSDAQIAKLYPARWFAEQVRERRARAAARVLLRGRWSPVRTLTASAALAALIVLAVRPRVFAPGAEDPTTVAPAIEDTRIKGSSPRLTLFRKSKDGSEVLQDGAVAHGGDLIRVGYSVAGRCYGAILSADGRGTVTLHLPEQGREAVLLQGGDTVLLDRAYELDDAPRWERFYLVTGDTPFDLAPVLEAARQAAFTGSTTKPTPLTLPAKLDQLVFSLEKGAGR
jgi:hypothetical protein